MEGYDTTILIDAFPGEGEAGTIFVMEPDLNELNLADGQPGFVEPHAMNPMNVLRMTTSMGGNLNRILLVGCIPATLGPEQGQMGLSGPVNDAVAEAVKVVEQLVTDLLAGNWPVKKDPPHQKGESHGS
jgi:hydrogenase maturation protease